MNSSGSARPSTSGPITIPSISSTTTTGGAKRLRQHDHRDRRERGGQDDREERALVDGDQRASFSRFRGLRRTGVRIAAVQGRPSSSLSFSITSTGSGSTPLWAARCSETRSPSSTAHSRRWTRVSPSVSILTTACAAGSISFAVRSARWRWRGCWSESSRKIAENAAARRCRAGPADDLVVVELGKLVLERVLLGVLVDLALPAVGHRHRELAAVDHRHGAGDLLGDLAGARDQRVAAARPDTRRRRRSRCASRRRRPPGPRSRTRR